MQRTSLQHQTCFDYYIDVHEGDQVVLDFYHGGTFVWSQYRRGDLADYRRKGEWFWTPDQTGGLSVGTLHMLWISVDGPDGEQPLGFSLFRRWETCAIVLKEQRAMLVDSGQLSAWLALQESPAQGTRSHEDSLFYSRRILCACCSQSGFPAL